MKEIIIKRVHESFGMINYKIVIENGQTILIRNGETKKVHLNELPVKAYVKQGWIKSKNVTIDHSTTELILKYEKIKSRITPWMGGLLALTILLPKTIWDSSPITNTFRFVGAFIILIWVIYAFIIKRDDWILIEKKKTI